MTENAQVPQRGYDDSLAVRECLVDALKLDLVGPGVDHRLSDERLPGWVKPSNWYLTGFLIPSETPFEDRADDDEGDVLDEIPDREGLAEESTAEHRAAKRGFFPSSIGLSFLVPASAIQLEVTVRWGNYTLGEMKGADGKPIAVWQRRAEERTVPLTLSGSDHRIPRSDGLRLHVASRPVDAQHLPDLPAGTRSVSVFLVNNRPPLIGSRNGSAGAGDQAYIFQAELEVTSREPFVPRPDPRGARTVDWDDLVADLHYADTPEYAVGHGVSAEWEFLDGECRLLRTAWIPTATVTKTQPVDLPDAVLSMEDLGILSDGEAAREALMPLVERYRAWIEGQGDGLRAHGKERREVGKELLRLAGFAADRMERGIGLLVSDPDALDAFRVANRCVDRALRQRLGDSLDGPPEWRTFQLAFILLNLPGLGDSHDPDRRIVDLLFFPTGGGKTEAYLGLAAFAMVLRRLRRPGEGGRHGAGVAVIMRYTLRLLTLDQLARASGLVCALELERVTDPNSYGTWPFEIGLWVGKAATPNIMGRKGDGKSDSARSKTIRFKSNPSSNPLPIPLESCPWCGTKFQPDSFDLQPNADKPRELRIVCTNFECDFSGDRPLPILGVDEPIYRRLPAFLIATVDKFASLPWTARTGVLLGGADRCDDAGFYGAADPAVGRPLGQPVPGPDLVIQDELHLISGPLGTMAGLYETVIEALCVRAASGSSPSSADSFAQQVRPKIVASTATVRQAQEQIQALFARSITQIFPPPGPDRRDSFFAEIAPADQVPGRQYLGITSPGRNPKVLMRRVWLALLGAAERAYRDSGGRGPDNPADPYMTVLGYFNSLRELGGARRILEEEVQNTIKSYSQRRRINERYQDGLFRDRQTLSEVLELTSRVSTAKVAEARRRLGLGAHEWDRVDNAIATNMISVGLDIPRLGLMVVVGQPKTHAEYIQATSRVGRVDEKPGLVVTLLNVHKPRDRSHYERFRHYHETFYRSVEVSSVTPFSARALDRGLAGALVAYARHAEAALTPPFGVEALDKVRASIETQLRDVFRERLQAQPLEDETERQERHHSVQAGVVDLLDSWLTVLAAYHDVNSSVKYQKYEPGQRGHLLREMLDEEFESAHHAKFRANRSLRDVEPEVNLYIKPLTASLSDSD